MDTELFRIFGDKGDATGAITIGILLIPLINGTIGLFTNWVAIKMMFLPIDWLGPRLPFKLGVGKYKIPLLGWQGVIPSKAAKMGSIAVDTGLAKLGTMHEFYNTLEPEVMAAHVANAARDDIHLLIDDILKERYPELWASAPEQLKRLVHSRVDAQMPKIIAEVMTSIGENIDRLIDLKLMVIRYLENDPKLLNKIFQDVGAKEFNFIVWSGLWVGALLGVPLMALWIFVQYWWIIPVGAAICGYLTNWIALKVIFEPLEPRKLGPFQLHGLFLRRQSEVSEAYSTIIAYDVVTLTNVANQMINGPDGDRTKRMIADIISPAVDEAVGMVRPALRAATLGRFDQIRDQVAEQAVDHTINTLLDERFSKERAAGLQALLAERMRVLSYRDFSLMLRSAFQQDEWLLIFVGALLGFAAGLVQLVTTLS